ncbi:MAG: histidine phosphatase family protein [Actinobacteria bacterium]|nr:histidine phosphatase family protein [Actinomycetota bacterium]
MTDTRVVLVRHGESFATVERFIGGPRSCRGLTDHGKEQARVLGERLARTGEITADVVVSSGYLRARQTAEIFAPYIGHATLDIREGFGEHDPGPDCDGMTYDDFVARHGRPDFGGDPHAVMFPGGETMAQFHDRVIVHDDGRRSRRRSSGGCWAGGSLAGALVAVAWGSSASSGTRIALARHLRCLAQRRRRLRAWRATRLDAAWFMGHRSGGWPRRTSAATWIRGVRQRANAACTRRRG